MDVSERQDKLLAALFVQPDGFYSEYRMIDLWPQARDARCYQGDLPVVAHPPCQLWGALAAVNFARWGGEHNRPGNDQGCFASALKAVDRFGGVLEHPAKSRAFQAHGLPRPSRAAKGWERVSERKNAWICEVWQSAYGHRANKATWLYYAGVNPPFDLRWERLVGSHQIGYWDQRGKERNKPSLTQREANATPPAFGLELLRLAFWSRLALS
jgi:hypothetical protein